MRQADVLELRKFVSPECVFGAGSRHLAANYAGNLGARKVLVVTDPGVEEAGWTGDVAEALRDAGVAYKIYDHVDPNPRSQQVMEGADLYLAAGCDGIIAVGGGSPMDCAKGIGIVSACGRTILEYEGVDKVSAPIPPLICVPTTGGSAADVSQFAIIEDEDRQVKIAIISKAIVPDVALIDPETLTSMPDDLSANTGMDTLCHAFEAYASNAHSSLTDVLALEAVRLIHKALPLSIEHPRDVSVRAIVATACMQAGLAFSNAGLGLVHAMAHSLGGYLDMAHGLANAILLPHVVAFNWTSAPDRYEALARCIGAPEGASAADACAALATLQQTLGVTASLKDLGVTRDDIPELARKAMDDPDIATNPRAPTLEDIAGIYERAL